MFVNNINKAAFTYGVDGIGIDLKYPGVQGTGGNIVSPSDAVNFLFFFQRFPSLLGTRSFDTNHSRRFNVSISNSSSGTNSFGKGLDMNYDVRDVSPSPGSNAPLSHMVLAVRLRRM
jgi:GH18 family chitinase